MNRKLLESIIGIGIFLIVLAFNPFALAGIYTDSSGSYGFITGSKILLLGILDLVLVIMWVAHIFKHKELTVAPTKVLIPVLFFVTSSAFSAFFSINKHNSFFGYQNTFSNSFLELMLLFIFFFIFINTIRSRESLERVIRVFLVSISFVIIWLIFRYTFTTQFNSVFLGHYLNSYLFSPSGHYGSFMPLFLTSFIISIGFIVLDLVEEKKIIITVIDSLLAITTGIGLINTFNLSSSNKDYFFLILAILTCILIGYMLYSSERLKKTFVITGSIFLISIILGSIVYFGLTKKTYQSFRYPAMPLNISWDISLDSLKDSIQKGIVGVGQGNFTYAFDKFKHKDTVSYNLTTNINVPVTKEFRMSHAGSYLLETLSAQGLIGFIALLGIIVTALYTGIKKLKTNPNILGIFLLIAFTILSISLMTSGYDFTLLFAFWLLLGSVIITLYEDEPQKALNLSLSNALEKANNFSYIIPALFIIPIVIVLYTSYTLTSANISLFWAKVFQSNGNIVEYGKSAYDALRKYPASDIFIRESAYADGLILFQNYTDLAPQNISPADTVQNQQAQEKLSQLQNASDVILAKIDLARKEQPYEYKNHFLRGAYLSQLSTYYKLQLDSQAITEFYNALSVNPTHPETYYQIATLFIRNNRFNDALSAIQEANILDQANPVYQIRYADILVQTKDYESALQIYNKYRDLKNKYTNDLGIQNLYSSEKIDEKIINAEKLKKEKAENDKKTDITPNLRLTITPTPNLK